MRHPTWRDPRRFCEVDGWEQRGGTRSDHDRYRKVLLDRSVLTTKLSRGRGDIGDPGLVRHILRDQLQVTDEQFWEAIDSGRPVDRAASGDGTAETRLESALPAWLVHNLIHVVGIREHEVLAMTAPQAENAWHAYIERPQ